MNFSLMKKLYSKGVCNSEAVLYSYVLANYNNMCNVLLAGHITELLSNKSVDCIQIANNSSTDRK